MIRPIILLGRIMAPPMVGMVAISPCRCHTKRVAGAKGVRKCRNDSSAIVLLGPVVKSTPILALLSAREHLGRDVLDHRVGPLEGTQGVRVALLGRLQQLAVFGRLGALPEDDPVYGGLRGERVELAQVAQEEQPRLRTAADHLRALLAQLAEQTRAVLARLASAGDRVTFLEGSQFLDVATRYVGERPGEVVDLLVDLVALADLLELVREFLLGGAHLPYG